MNSPSMHAAQQSSQASSQSAPKDAEELCPKDSLSRTDTLCATTAYLNGVYFSIGTPRARCNGKTLALFSGTCVLSIALSGVVDESTARTQAPPCKDWNGLMPIKSMGMLR